MLGDKIKEADIFELLHSEDAKIILAARNILKEAPLQSFINGDNVDRIWFDKNIRAQELLLQLKTRVDSIANNYQLDFYKLEGSCLGSGEYEFVKARDERISTMMSNEPSLYDKRASINKLTAISQYLDGLLWSLRDLMKLFKK